MAMPVGTPRSIGVDVDTMSRWISRGLVSARKIEGGQLRSGLDQTTRVEVTGEVPPLMCSGDDLVATKARHLD
jgi:hypothetical protein